MKAVTAEQMREIDRATIEDHGIPGLVLMGYAGRAVYDYLLEQYPCINRAAVFSGRGNNGGDGFVVAYLLHNAGVKTTVYFTGSRKKLSESSATYHDLCKNSGVPIIPVTAGNSSGIRLEENDIVIDALLGTGFEGDPREPVSGLIDSINDAKVPVVSIDMPTGLPSDGEGPVRAVRADHTVTMGLPKISLVTFPGREYAGKLHVADIGFPSYLSEPGNEDTEVIDYGYCSAVFRPLKEEMSDREDINKSDRGHLLIVGGFDGMEGAAMMTALGALETGAGLVTLVTTEGARAAIAGKIPELITRSLGGKNPENDLHDILATRRYNVVAAGPGMGRSSFAEGVLRSLMMFREREMLKICIDGDGLFHLKSLLDGRALPSEKEIIITPHMMEASRLSGTPLKEIEKNRYREARSLSEKTGTVTVLKGPATIVSRGSKTLINSTGNRALATAGTGDVLTGIIGSLLLKDMTPVNAAGAGVFIHGAAADRYIRDNGQVPMKATDLLPYIRPVIRSL